MPVKLGHWPRRACSACSTMIVKVKQATGKAWAWGPWSLLRERLCWCGHVERSSGAVRTACDKQIDGRRRAGRPKLTWKKLTEKDHCEWKLMTVDPQERSTWRSGVRSAVCVQLASYLERGPLMWMMTLHLNQKSDYDDEWSNWGKKAMLFFFYFYMKIVLVVLIGSVHGRKFKIFKILNFWNSNLKTYCMCLQKITISIFNGQLLSDKLILLQRSCYNLPNSVFWGWLSLESQPQNPEFRINPENFHPWTVSKSFSMSTHNICFGEGIRILGWTRPLFSRAIWQQTPKSFTRYQNILQVFG